jgi:hypothetical protein
MVLVLLEGAVALALAGEFGISRQCEDDFNKRASRRGA